MDNAIQEQKDYITGLQAHLRDLRGQRDLFIKASSMQEQTEKLRQEAEKSRTDLDGAKKELASLQEKKRQAIQGTADSFVGKINAHLPTGEATFRIEDDGAVFIGLKEDGRERPYEGLSGGEKILFNSALVAALGAMFVIVEGAECDDANLARMMEKYAASQLQVILSTCHSPSKVGDAWKAVELC